ncbi:pitrilysin family protein [Zoogloea sp. LCSB751]|uniref:M16 family metallopeptidase n=1 Tax=Zoogloea sp. LCSB751 TaxID=1965277 RepID=UPI0009A4F6C0|nr:pitrilysin family protein [Zoogloea sp. LCSB751]
MISHSLRLGAAVALTLATLSAHAGLNIQTWTAASGAKVFFVESHALPIVDVQVDFRAGGAEVPAGKAGIAGLTRGLLDAGAGSLDEEAIANRVADLGVQLGGDADMDRASLSLRTLSNPEERNGAVDLLATLIQQPTFPAAIVEREKARSIAGLKEADTQPDAILARRFAAAVFPSHPYGRLPSVETVSSITREELVDFHKRNYTAARAVVSIVGDVSRAEAEGIASRLTSGLPAGEAPSATANTALPQAQIIRVPNPSAQAHISVGQPGIRRGDPDFFPLVVGNYILGGGGFVSRLTNEVREKRGYAYSVYSYFMPQRDVGPFEIGLQTKGSQADDALRVVSATLDEFLAKGPTAAELQAAKDNLINGFALRLDSNRKMLEQVAVIGGFGLPLDYLDTYRDKVKAVTVAQVRDAFRRHVSKDHLVTVVVGGDGDKSAPVKTGAKP